MKYDINNLPKKVKVVKENDVWPLKTLVYVNQRMVFKELIYLGLEAGILEPYEEEEEEQEKLREEIIEKLKKTEIDWGNSFLLEILKDYKITKI